MDKLIELQLLYSFNLDNHRKLVQNVENPHNSYCRNGKLYFNHISSKYPLYVSTERMTEAKINFPYYSYPNF